MTQPRRAQPADFLVAAVHNASRTALSLAVVLVALIATDAAVAVSRTAGPSEQAPVATRSAPAATATTPGVAAGPTSTSTAARGKTGKRVRHGAAKALLARAVANALAQGSVHTVARNVSDKVGKSVFDNYDTRTGGTQHITIYGGNLHVRVVGPTTYFTGDKRGLTRFFGFTAAEVAVLDHHWLALREGQAGYKVTTAGITLRSVLHVDRIVGRLRLLPAQVRDGVRVVGVRGRAGGHLYGKHATATMWIDAGAQPLPVRFVVTSPHARSVQTFSEWGKPVRVDPPANVFGSRTLEG
ncbi:MAG TPA: hypothetical protein VHE57_04090 [Mycobacteriales bacterium]|nr:hypothetical protein [Mycobacteriales bacterium]